MLFITEVTEIMNKLESISTFALVASIWLEYFASLDIFRLLKLTLVALECSFLHFRNNIRVSNNNTLDGDEFIDVRWI